MEWKRWFGDRTAVGVQLDFQNVFSNWMKFSGNDNPDREGCVGTVLDDTTGDLLMPQQFLGVIPEGKSGLYAFFSLEKAIRIGDHLEHVTSAASALPKEVNDTLATNERKYAGAVRCPLHLRFSTSGFTGAGDQAFSAAMLDRSGLLSVELLNQIEEESGSPLTRAFVLYDREQRS